jgi:ribosomal protein S20
MSVATRTLSYLPEGTALSRYMMAKAIGRGDAFSAQMIAERWCDSPQVKACLEDELHTKAAVAPGTTSECDVGATARCSWHRSRSARTRARPEHSRRARNKFRRVPFRTTVRAKPAAVPAGRGSAKRSRFLPWRRRTTRFAQEAYKAQVITVLTRELLQFSRSAERALRETVAAGLAAYLDAQLLTNTVTLIANVRPAAITSGATAVVSTGSTAAAINADLAGCSRPLQPAAPVWCGSCVPPTAYKIAATIGGTAAADVPRTLFGIPLVLSANSPQQVTLIDASHVLYSDDGAIELDTTDEATIQMDSAPTDPAVAATVFQSLWDRNLCAVRATRWVAWLRAQTGAVAYMTVAY